MIVDARPGEFAVTKLFDDLPCAHRAWAHDGLCRFLHGYERSFEIEFVCRELEADTGFVVDFGKLKPFRSMLERQFDHTTLIADNDPELELFRELGRRGVIDLRIMSGTNMEASAAWVLKHGTALLREQTDDRVRIRSIVARESRKNSVRMEPASVW
ncbi:6-carboxytetrahydropterin synthase [Microbacterium sp.]|uniref:6-carboxytetrahydropterin synthase n=1 Tax=Microbacterium sp. TaxID=51671 RepID=UPI0039E3584E